MLSDSAVSQSLSWISDCCERHPACLPRPQCRTLPSRLVDVGIRSDADGPYPPPRLVETGGGGQAGQYVVLSYCWGQASRPVMTTRSTISTHVRDGLPVDDLPQTVLDAIEITRRLGKRYLWVDVLCIVQDSRENKDREISRLQDYFAESFVTVIAASAESCMSGFLQSRRDFRGRFQGEMLPDRLPPSFKIPWLCRDGRMGQVLFQPWIRHDLMEEPVSKRAWVCHHPVADTLSTCTWANVSFFLDSGRTFAEPTHAGVHLEAAHLDVPDGLPVS